MQTNPAREPMFIPIIAPKYTPKTPILSGIASKYAKNMLNISSRNIVRPSDLKPEPIP